MKEKISFLSCKQIPFQKGHKNEEKKIETETENETETETETETVKIILAGVYKIFFVQGIAQLFA